MVRLSREQAAEILEEYHTLERKKQAIVERILLSNFKNDRVTEFANHGFCRRLGTLFRCIENIFDEIPPDREDVPTEEERADLCIHLQAFVFNVYGSIDNLAWMWVFQQNLTRQDGNQIPASHVGLRKKNSTIRESLPKQLDHYLDGLEEWFEMQENYRHALAHRIPLYVAPYVVFTNNENLYHELERGRMLALRNGEMEEYERLSEQQDELKVLGHVMTHSLNEKAKPVVFHAQVIADFNTVHELAGKILDHF